MICFFRAVRAAFPFTRDGRQTLIYLTFAGCGPALTLVVMWAMNEALGRPALWKTFSTLAYVVALSLLIIVTGLGMFVSIRAVKISKDGFEAEGGGAPAAAQAVADSAQHTADTIRGQDQ